MYRPPPPPGNYSPYGTPPMPAATPAAAPWGAPPMSVWKEHTTPEGKKYWYNTATRASTWEKPDELLTPEERVLKTSAWKEYTTPEGKKYYSNVKTKETVWEIPAELKQQIEKARKEALENRVVEQPTPLPPVRPIVPTLPPMPMTSQLIDQTTVPEFTSREQAEKAFHGLLKETGVKSDWSWDQAMRAIITNPLYRALKTTAERKAAFHRWAEAEAKREREEKEHRETRQRNNFFSMLRHQKDNIKSYTRYRTLAKLCGHLSAYQAVPDRQREIYFDEFIQQVQREEKDRLRDLRKESMDKFSKLLRSIPEISYKTSWKEAQALYLQKQKQEHVSLEGMDMLDFLSVFEEYNRTLWEEPMQELNNKIFKRRRKERKAREGFRQLLQELVERRQINVRTLWKEIYPVIKDDPRFLSAVGLPDSTPLDMFWDVIDALDEELYQQKKLVYHSLKKSDYDVGLESSFEDYLNALDEQVKTEVSQDNLRFVFEHLQAKAAQRIKDEKRRQEKKHRKKLDIFRYALKHAIPPIQLEETWEQVKSRVEHLEEYKELEEEYRQEVFDRYMKRLKEKKEDEEEEEEGMIREDEDEDMHNKRRSRRKEYESEEEERNKKRRKHLTKSYSDAEEGEALDDYQNDPRRLK